MIKDLNITEKSERPPKDNRQSDKPPKKLESVKRKIVIALLVLALIISAVNLCLCVKTYKNIKSGEVSVEGTLTEI